MSEVCPLEARAKGDLIPEACLSCLRLALANKEFRYGEAPTLLRFDVDDEVDPDHRLRRNLDERYDRTYTERTVTNMPDGIQVSDEQTFFKCTRQ